MNITLTPNVNNDKFYDICVNVDTIPHIDAPCIYKEDDGHEFHYGESNGVVSYYTCGITQCGHNRNYHWSSRCGVFNGMFGKRCMDVMFNDGHYTMRGAMTVEAVEKLLKNKPYIVTIREEYCWDGEIAYGIKKL